MKKFSVLIVLAVIGIATQICSCRSMNTETNGQTTAPSDGTLELGIPRLPTKVNMCACECTQNNGALFRNNGCSLTGFNFYAKTNIAKQDCLTKMNGQACSGYSQIKSVLANPKGGVAAPECKGPIAGTLTNCAMKTVNVWPDQPPFPPVPEGL